MVKSTAPDRRLSFSALLLAYLVAGAAAVTIAAVARRLLLGLHPVIVAGAADLLATIVVFAFSAGFDNSSIYDPFWSVAPVPIALFWVLASDGAGTRPRQAAVLILLAAWALRLTVNCIARWRGLGYEDWRYAGYRRLGVGYWPVSFLGFHLMPTLLVFLGCLPLWPALTSGGTAIGILDLAATLVTAGAIGIEAVSDLQLRWFLARPKSGRRLIDEGLWKLVRHPNYLGEVLFWWGLWLFGLAANPSWWWTIAGPGAITLMFLLVSVPMMNRHLRRRRTYASPRRRTASSTMAR
jgi:steroid 5-alpha reductase family enzyme